MAIRIRGWTATARWNTFQLIAAASAYPAAAPTRPPMAPRATPSPMNSPMIDRDVAPSALRRPISLRRSVTTAIIVVDTPMVVSARTITVMMPSRERSMSMTPESDWTRRLTVWARTEGTEALIESTSAVNWSPSRATEYWAMEGSQAPVSSAMSSADM